MEGISTKVLAFGYITTPASSSSLSRLQVFSFASIYLRMKKSGFLSRRLA